MKTSDVSTHQLKSLLLRVPDLVAAVILLQTLYFKFTAAPESVYIFSTLGAEPFGRIASGVVELFAAVLLLIPRTAWYGALCALAVMGGAIITHFTVLGIEVLGDGGTLFFLALTVGVLSLIILYRDRAHIIALLTAIRARSRS